MTCPRFIFLFIILFVSYQLSAQQYKAIVGNVHFFSSAPVEDIEATNKKASSVLDLSTGNIVFSVPVKQFSFEKSLMKEHFNENYLESDKYPKIIFTGKMSTSNLQVGNNQLTIKGQMNLHGVKKEIEVSGSMDYAQNMIIAHAEFLVNLADYKIKIPKAVFYNIAEEIAITVDFTYEKI